MKIELSREDRNIIYNALAAYTNNAIYLSHNGIEENKAFYKEYALKGGKLADRIRDLDRR